jgi:multicomponent Na+:H+ antiporter subunit E
MKTFGFHFFLALVLAYLFFLFTDLLPYNASTGLVVFLAIFSLLWLSSAAYHPSYFRKVPKAISFLGFFLKEVFVANVKIAVDILTPRYRMQPTVIAYPLSVQTDVEIMLLACIITLTPGTLSIDVSKDRKTLYIHALYFGKGGVEGLKKSFKTGFERRLMQLTA